MNPVDFEAHQLFFVLVGRTHQWEPGRGQLARRDAIIAKSTNLRPVRSQCIHIHHIQQACKAFIESPEGLAQVPEPFYVHLEGFCFIDQLGHDWFEEPETVWGIRVLL